MKIKVLILDVGGVLIRWNWDAWCGALGRAYNTTAQRIQELWSITESGLHEGVLPAFLSGATSEDTLRTHLTERFGVALSAEEFRDLWQREGDHAPEQQLIDHIRAVAKHHRLTLISCTNIDPILSTSYRKDGEALHGLFHHEVQSCHPHIQELKPAPKMFQTALALARQHARAEPDQCLFVDDRPENVSAARKHGMKTIHYHCPHSCMAELNAHGLHVPTAT